jgi:hypothetical protein
MCVKHANAIRSSCDLWPQFLLPYIAMIQGRKMGLPSPRSHAPTRLRVRARQCRTRHALDPGLSRAHRSSTHLLCHRLRFQTSGIENPLRRLQGIRGPCSCSLTRACSFEPKQHPKRLPQVCCAQWRQSMKKISALAAVLLIATVIGGPAALAQTTGTPNSGAGVQGLPGNKSGPAAKPEQNPSGQSSGVSQDQSKVPGLRGNKSGPAPEKPSK